MQVVEARPMKLALCRNTCLIHSLLLSHRCAGLPEMCCNGLRYPLYELSSEYTVQEVGAKQDSKSYGSMRSCEHRRRSYPKPRPVPGQVFHEAQQPYLALA